MTGVKNRAMGGVRMTDTLVARGPAAAVVPDDDQVRPPLTSHAIPARSARNRQAITTRSHDVVARDMPLSVRLRRHGGGSRLTS